MVTKQKRFYYFNILETLKDSPNAPPSLNFLEQRVHELVESPLPPPPGITILVPSRFTFDSDGPEECISS